jgi:hypothetical protein
MKTPAHRVIPKAPTCHAARLLTSAPRQPAAKQTRIFFKPSSTEYRDVVGYLMTDFSEYTIFTMRSSRRGQAGSSSRRPKTARRKDKYDERVKNPRLVMPDLIRQPEGIVRVRQLPHIGHFNPVNGYDSGIRQNDANLRFPTFTKLSSIFASISIPAISYSSESKSFGRLQFHHPLKNFL